MPMPDTSTKNERARNLKLHIEDAEDQIDAALAEGRDAKDLYLKLEDLENQLKEAESAQKTLISFNLAAASSRLSRSSKRRLSNRSSGSRKAPPEQAKAATVFTEKAVAAQRRSFDNAIERAVYSPTLRSEPTPSVVPTALGGRPWRRTEATISTGRSCRPRSR